MEYLTTYKQGEKITVSELCEKFRKYNDGHSYAGDDRKPLEALILLSQDLYSRPVEEEDRCYHFTSKNKMFYSDTLGYSCFGHSRRYGDRLENEIDTGKGVLGVVLLNN